MKSRGTTYIKSSSASLPFIALDSKWKKSFILLGNGYQFVSIGSKFTIKMFNTYCNKMIQRHKINHFLITIIEFWWICTDEKNIDLEYKLDTDINIKSFNFQFILAKRLKNIQDILELRIKIRKCFKILYS